MKSIIKFVLPAISAFALLFISCEEDKMEWGLGPGKNPIDVSEIPLTQQERLDRYAELKSYASFPLGIGVDLTLYKENPKYKAVIDENFEVLTIGYHMKHGAMMGSDGVIRFTNVDQLFSSYLPAGMTVFGHTLVWHQNQNGEYLRTLVAPEIIPPDPSASNMLNLTGLKNNSFSGWTKQNAGDGITVVDGEGLVAAGKALKMISKSSSSKIWDLQLTTPVTTVEVGKTYTISFYVRSDKTGKGRISFAKGLTNQYPYMDWYGTGSAVEAFETGSTWKQVKFNIVAEDTQLQFNFDLGYLPSVTYYIDVDNIVVSDPANIGEPTVVEKTDEEKAQIIDDAMKLWISQMVSHYKNDVKAWDVVNEPMADDGSGVRYGTVEDTGDTFHWQNYIGKDYAVKAFNYARAAGNPTDILFINDYNLEYNLAKTRALIDYVNYIESKGERIDGIGTQMHISIDTNMDNVDEMFRLLAETGKLIKVSELDIKVNTASPTPEQLEEQSEMYRKVVESYVKHTPEAQRYGVTIWGVTDDDSWIENDAPCLWNAKYARKIGYKGFADGLAGRDVSEDFTYE